MSLSKELRTEIERARESFNNLLTLYIDATDINATQGYKRMLDYQRKSLEELIKMYRTRRDEENRVGEDEY